MYDVTGDGSAQFKRVKVPDRRLQVSRLFAGLSAQKHGNRQPPQA